MIYTMGKEHRRKPSNEAGSSEHEEFMMVDVETDDGTNPEEISDKSTELDQPGQVRTIPRGDEYNVDFS